MAQPSDREPADLSGAGLRAFAQIAKAWGLREDEQIQILGLSGLPGPQALDEDPDAVVDDDVLQRIGHVISIYKSLHTLFSDRAQADTWVHRANSAAIFEGQPAIKLLRSADVTKLQAVRDYLNSQLG